MVRTLYTRIRMPKASAPAEPGETERHSADSAERSSPDAGTPRPLEPGSVAWRAFADPRGFLLAGTTLLLQVAHPDVGAAVAEHSDYKSDPWGRLQRTLDFYLPVLFGGPGSIEAGARIRRMHGRIDGTGFDGRPYSAFDPEAYHWVHATLVNGPVAAHSQFGRPLTARELDLYYAEMREVGRILQVADADMPPDWAGFRRLYDEIVEDRLIDNVTVQEVIESLRNPARPLKLPLPVPLWRASMAPPARVVRLATTATLPPVLRERFGLSWTQRDARELRALTAVIRGTVPLLPRPLREFGPSYVAVRARQRHRARRRGLEARAAHP